MYVGTHIHVGNFIISLVGMKTKLDTKAELSAVRKYYDKI